MDRLKSEQNSYSKEASIPSLDEREELFASTFIRSGLKDVGEAYKKAYDDKDELNENECAVLGRQLLGTWKVREYVQRVMALITSSRGSTPEKVIYGLYCGAFADIANAYDKHNKPLPLHQIDPETRFAITGVGKGGNYTFMDKTKSLVLLAQLKTLLPESTGSAPFSITVNPIGSDTCKTDSSDDDSMIIDQIVDKSVKTVKKAVGKPKPVVHRQASSDIDIDIEDIFD